MKKRSKLFLTSVFSTSLIFSGVVLMAALTSCFTEKKEEDKETKNNTITNTISIQQLKLDNLTKTQFLNEYQNNPEKINNLIKTNLALFISGPIEQIKDNFVATLVTDQNNIYVELTVNRGFWYKDNVLILDSELTNRIQLIGFKKELSPDDDGGGIYNDLSIDKHLKLVDVLLGKLDVHSNYNISNISNDKLNNIYKSLPKYNQLNCEIQNESTTKDGVLVLKINGNFEDRVFTDVIVRISGFKTPKQISKAFINNFKLNLKQWFIDLKPTQTIKKEEILNIASNEFLNKYLLSATLSYVESQEIKEFMSLKDALSNNYLIEFQKPILNKEGKTFQLLTNSINAQTKKYSNGTWVDDELIEITKNNQPRISEVTIPTDDNALQFILDTTTINETILQQNYASYFKAQAMNAKELKVNYPQIPDLIQNQYLDSIKSTYFPNIQHLLLNLSSNPTSFSINDITRSLEFTLQISVNDEVNPRAHKLFSFQDKTKSLNELINSTLMTSKNNFPLLLNDETGNWANTFLLRLKKQYKSVIDEIYNDPTAKNKEIAVNLLSSPLNNMKQLAYSNSNDWNEDDPKLEKIKNNSIDGCLRVFDKEIEYMPSVHPLITLTKDGQINKASGLFRYDVDNVFMINDIYYDVPNNFSSLFLTHVHQGAITLRAPFKTIVALDNKTIETESFISIVIPKTKWDSLKIK